MRNFRISFVIPALIVFFLAAVLISCPPPAGPPPTAPDAPVLNPGNTQIDVSWTAVDDATAYNVYYGTEDDSGTAVRYGPDTPSTSLTVNDLANGTTYYVWLKAKNANGTSGFSPSSSAATTGSLPPAPGAPALTPGDGQIGVSWTAVGGAASYNVFYNTVFDSGSAAQFGGDVAGTSTTVTGLANGTRYFVWVKSKNAGGTSAFSLSALSRPAGASVPGTPFEALGGGAAPDVSRFNGAHICAVFAPQPAGKPQSNSAPSTTYSFTFTPTGADSVTAREIPYGSLIQGSLGAGESQWYYFRASSGAEHTLFWDDYFQGSGTYSCDVVVSAYRENLTTSYFTNRDSGYSAPPKVTASATEMVFIKVKGYFYNSAGTFALMDTPSVYPSIVPPPVVKNQPKKEGGVDFADDRALTPRPRRASVYGAEQTDLDLRMRAAENQALAGGARQLNKTAAGIDKAAPSPISVGTVWSGVKIALTGHTIDATCQYITTRAYFFVDNRDTAAMSSYLDGYGTAFDAIWTVNHAHFGSENDVDGNGRVIIIFSRELSGGVLGYFYSHDKYPASTYSNSNEGDIFYITADAAYQGNLINGTLSHEFQHMIYFDEHYNRGVTSTYSWLNEALSQAAEYYNGYTANHLAWIEYFLYDNWTGLSLTHWTSDNYGYGAIFIRYLIDRFGDTAIQNLCATALTGIAAVEAATGEDFNVLFNDFMRALVMSGTGDSADPKYTFTTLDLPAVQDAGRGGLTSSAEYNSPIAVSGPLRPYGISFSYWPDTFGTMSLSGTDVNGAGFGLSR
ncbi:MAG: fibronectin type III domain-containing protein [Spirochaetales bacterium]|nr:fibronectin type III domain-containing protein [Spirochaetales bacterium]